MMSDSSRTVSSRPAKLVRTPAVSSGAMLFSNILRDELERRKSRNHRYSVRAFARHLGVHHSTLSRVMRGTQRLAAPTIGVIAARLRLAADTVRDSERSEVDQAVLAAVARRGFRPDCRWISAVTGIPIDDVNASLHRLLRDRELRMDAHDRWTIVQ